MSFVEYNEHMVLYKNKLFVIYLILISFPLVANTKVNYLGTFASYDCNDFERVECLKYKVNFQKKIKKLLKKKISNIDFNFQMLENENIKRRMVNLTEKNVSRKAYSLARVFQTKLLPDQWFIITTLKIKIKHNRNRTWKRISTGIQVFSNQKNSQFSKTFFKSIKFDKIEKLENLVITKVLPYIQNNKLFSDPKKNSYKPIFDIRNFGLPSYLSGINFGNVVYPYSVNNGLNDTFLIGTLTKIVRVDHLGRHLESIATYGDKRYQSKSINNAWETKKKYIVTSLQPRKIIILDKKLKLKHKVYQPTGIMPFQTFAFNQFLIRRPVTGDSILAFNIKTGQEEIWNFSERNITAFNANKNFFYAIEKNDEHRYLISIYNKKRMHIKSILLPKYVNGGSIGKLFHIGNNNFLLGSRLGGLFLINEKGSIYHSQKIGSLMNFHFAMSKDFKTIFAPNPIEKKVSVYHNSYQKKKLNKFDSMKMASALFRKKKYLTSLSIIGNSKSMSNEYIPLGTLKTRILIQLKQIDSALEILETLVENFPKDQKLTKMLTKTRLTSLTNSAQNTFILLKQATKKFGKTGALDVHRNLSLKLAEINEVDRNNKIASRITHNAKLFMDQFERNKKAPAIKILSIQTEEIFSSLYKYYFEKDILKIKIKNTTGAKITSIKAFMKIEKYMDFESSSETIDSLGENINVSLSIKGKFNKKLLELVEDTPLGVQVRITYEYQSISGEVKAQEKIYIRNRNALTWKDPKRLGAFVTLKDSVVKSFARGVMEKFRNVKYNFIPSNLLKAMAIFDSLSQFGLAYVPDPKTPFSRFSKLKNAIDYIQYPRDVLKYKSGDCDDLTILYAALLENIGISTVFILVPGHIFLAFDSGLHPKNRIKVSSQKMRSFVFKGRLWIPVELTLAGEYFENAWLKASEQYAQHKKNRKVERIQTAKAWREYIPASLPSTYWEAKVPAKDFIDKYFTRDINKYIEREFKLKIKKRQDTGFNNYKEINQMGILYARFGRFENALKTFHQGIIKFPQASKIFQQNIGNIYSMMKKFQLAIKYYKMANKIESSGISNINIARVYYLQNKIAKAKRFYIKAVKIMPSLKKHYDYILQSSEVRASAKIGERNELWDSEEK